MFMFFCIVRHLIIVSNVQTNNAYLCSLSWSHLEQKVGIHHVHLEYNVARALIIALYLENAP